MDEKRALFANRIERRNMPRRKVDHTIAVQHQNRTLTGVCLDYSEGGFGAIVEGELPIGEIVSVEFQVPGRELTWLQVKTLYRQDSRYGFGFVAPRDNRRRTIGEFQRKS